MQNVSMYINGAFIWEVCGVVMCAETKKKNSPENMNLSVLCEITDRIRMKRILFISCIMQIKQIAARTISAGNSDEFLIERN